MAAGCSAIFMLDQKGKILIARNYRGDVPMACAERFIAKIMEEEEMNLRPVVEEDGITYVYIKSNNIYILAVTNRNANPSMIIVFLYKLVEVFKQYFKELEEESVRDNFVIIYELLDEMMDFGYPQTTESMILKEYITQEGHKLDVDVRPPPAITNAVSWRGEGIKYKKNEVFLDVMESVNLLVNMNGTVLRSEIVGAIKMKCHLSGMPELRLGLNDRVQFDGGQRSSTQRGRAIEMEDVNFHQCVRLSRFETDRTIAFIPPDGEFELMTYRLNTQIKPLIWIEAVVDRHQHSRVEYMIKARSQFKQRSTANNVCIRIPVPEDADSPKFKASIGKVEYVPEDNVVVWKIKQFQGRKEYLMRAHFGLPSITNEENADDRPPVTVNFEIPYFTVSGIQVRYLKIIERSGYQALPWVRYITQSGDYQIRVMHA
eukprot:TRINITY_DN2044_c0_g1_i1.p1 TRINITY_DN2044_c0_g1~~TRINITY_DN2044_c0_g1_i1.p1  ORF type:complete len:430 (-),score=176.31 TRINITY_DN2044_c0_g1_i1:306-1595(-)